MELDTVRTTSAELAESEPVWLARPRISFLVLGIVQVTLIAAMTVVSVALPAIQRDLGLSGSGLALVNNAYAVAFCGLLLLGGRLGDLFGLRRALIAGLVVFGLASAANALAASFLVLLAARFAQGCGAALAAPAAMALVSVIFREPARRMRAIAIWGGFPVVGATLGILLSGFIANWVSWRWAFVVPVLVVVTILGVLRRVVPAGPAPVRTRLDVLGAVLVTTGLSGACYGLVEASERGWLAPIVFFPLSCGAALLVLFLLVEARTSRPLVPLSFFRSRRRIIGLLGVMLASSATVTTTFFLPLFFQQVQGYSPVATSVAFLPYGAAMFATGLIAGWLAVRMGARTMTAIGLAVAALGLWTLGRLEVDSAYPGLLLAGLMIFPVGAALIFSAATTAAMEDVADDQAGMAGGVLNTAMEGGPTVGFALLVSVAGARTAILADQHAAPPVATTGGYGFALTIAAIVFAGMMLVAWLGLRPRRAGCASVLG